MSDTCPRCGAEASRICYWPSNGTLYQCGTRVDYGEFYRSDQCRIRELQSSLDAANKRIAELTEGAEVVGGDVLRRLRPDTGVLCNSTRYWIVSKEYNTRHAAEKALKGTP